MRENRHRRHGPEFRPHHNTKVRPIRVPKVEENVTSDLGFRRSRRTARFNGAQYRESLVGPPLAKEVFGIHLNITDGARERQRTLSSVTGNESKFVRREARRKEAERKAEARKPKRTEPTERIEVHKKKCQ